MCNFKEIVFPPSSKIAVFWWKNIHVINHKKFLEIAFKIAKNSQKYGQYFFKATPHYLAELFQVIVFPIVQSSQVKSTLLWVIVTSLSTCWLNVLFPFFTVILLKIQVSHPLFVIVVTTKENKMIILISVFCTIFFLTEKCWHVIFCQTVYWKDKSFLNFT